MRSNAFGRFCAESIVGASIASFFLFIVLPGLNGTVYEKQILGWLTNGIESDRQIKLVLVVVGLGLLTGCIQPTVDFLRYRNRN